MGNKDSKTHPADEEVTTLFQISQQDQFTLSIEERKKLDLLGKITQHLKMVFPKNSIHI